MEHSNWMRVVDIPSYRPVPQRYEGDVAPVECRVIVKGEPDFLQLRCNCQPPQLACWEPHFTPISSNRWPPLRQAFSDKRKSGHTQGNR